MISTLSDWNSLVTLILGVLGVLLLLYRRSTSGYDYFRKQNIAGPKPLPLVGNLWGLWRETLTEYDVSLAKKYGKVFGVFDGSLPNLYIMEPELIKQVFIKDFEHFINRRDVKSEHKYIRMLLTIMRDQEWKNLRSAVSPTFSSGKIKRMTKLIHNCSLQFVEKFREVARTNGKLNAKDKLTMDIIATCAFGVKIGFSDGADDPFMTRARVLFDKPLYRSPAVLLPLVFPKLRAKLSRRSFPTKVFDFFIEIVKDAMAVRKSNGEKYDDFIDSTLESIAEISHINEKNGGRIWNRGEMEEITIAQALLFLLAGFHTTASTLNNCVFHLAKNPDLQDRLNRDIQAQFDIFGDISHEMLQNVPYADQFVHEVLRVSPPIIRIERACNKDIHYGDIFVKKGSIVTMPVYAVHHSEEFYPQPEKFDPDRWTPENKAKRSPYVFAPFGLGPRNCVGMRFALEELKIVLCTVVKEFRFFDLPETPETIHVNPGLNLLLQPMEMNVGIEERS